MRKILGLILLCLCFHHALAADAHPKNSAADKSFVRGAPVPAWVDKTPVIPSTNRTDPLIIRLADTQVDNGSEFSVHYVRAIQVNEQAALDAIGQYAISYMPDYQRLLVHKVAILRKGQLRDETSRVTMHLLQREQQLESGVIGGQVSLQMLLSDVRVGDTLFVSYTIRGKNPVFGGRWSDTFAWDSSVPTEYRRLIVSHDRKQPLYWTQRGDFKTAAIPFRSEPSGKDEKLVFEERALDAVEIEPGTPSDYLPGRVLEFSEYRDWHEVAEWGGKLFPAQSPDPALRTLIQEFSKEDTPEKRAAAALHWVQGEIRYLSVSLGESSHRPRRPALVLSTRFGDCKDKSYLLATLLTEMGIKASPVLVSAAAPTYPVRALPAPQVFDHVILRAVVNGHVYYLDPTRSGQTEALDRLPVPVPDAAGLVLDAATAALAILPADRRATPQFEISERFALPSLDGDGRLETRRIYRDNYAAAMRRAFGSMPASGLAKYALGLYEKNYPGLTLATPPAVTEEGGNTVLSAAYVLRKPLSRDKERYELAFTNKVLEGALDLPDNIVRNYPFVPPIGHFQGRHVVQVIWPQRVRINDEVSAKTLENRYFRYHREYAFRGNVLEYQMDFASKGDRVEAAEMPQLQSEVNRLEKMLIGSFNVADDTLGDERASKLRYRDIEGSGAAISFGKQASILAKNPGDHTVEEWCTLLAQAFLGVNFIPEEGRKHVVNLRIPEQAKAGSHESRRCPGSLAFMRQDFAMAVQYLGSAPLDASAAAVQQLAWARLFQKDPAGARKEMQRYYDHRVASGIDSPLDLVRYVALLKRSGAGIPDHVQQRLVDQSSSVWPRPVAAYLAGNLTADALLAAAQAVPATAREFAQAEAWYYIGISRVVDGDTGGARRAFRYLLANGVPSTMEYMLANAEFDRLSSKDPDFLAGSDLEAQKKYALAAQHYEKAVARGDAQATFALALLHYYGNGTAQDKARAFPLLRQAAEGDIPGAQNMMGIYYEDGEGGIAPDTSEAERWYGLSAGQYDRHGMRNLANFLIKKYHGASPQYERSLNYLQQVAGMGSHDAQADLARNLRWQHPESAMFWSEFAASDGQPEHQLLLAEQLSRGGTVFQDGERAQRILTSLAKQGNIPAQLELGLTLEYGNGVAKNRKLALEWFEKAAAQGSAIGKMRVARFYLYGQDAGTDYEKAHRLLREAADADVAYANILLAEMYGKGLGVAQDKQRVSMYAERAIAGGMSDALVQIGDMFYFGEQEREQAVEWYRKAVSNGSSRAMNNLGDMYENGVGVPQDFAEAMKLYRQAALQGEGIAFRSLASMWASGKAGKVDLRQAYLCYLLAAKIETDIADDAKVLRSELKPDDVRMLEAQADKWKKGDPLPSA